MRSNISGSDKMPVGFQDRETTFPFMIYDLLEGAYMLGIEEIVSWNADGQSFQVHDREKFTTQVLPRAFKQTRFKSFQRQLNLYFFQRIRVGPLRGSYAHRNFRRGERKLCHLIIRISSPGIQQCASSGSTSTGMTSKKSLLKGEHDVLKDRERLTPHQHCKPRDTVPWHQKTKVYEPAPQCSGGKLQFPLLHEQSTGELKSLLLVRRCERSMRISPTNSIHQQEEEASSGVATPPLRRIQNDRSIVDEIIATFQNVDKRFQANDYQVLIEELPQVSNLCP